VWCAFCWLLNLRRKLIQGRIEWEFRISGHTQKSEDFETYRRNQSLTAFRKCFKAIVAAMWPVWIPNVCISLRIFLTIPATVASAERFFSKIKLVKNYLRSAMSQTRLVDLARLNIESSIARKVDFDSVIRNFANKNTRKSLVLQLNDFFLNFFLD